LKQSDTLETEAAWKPAWADRVLVNLEKPNTEMQLPNTASCDMEMRSPTATGPLRLAEDPIFAEPCMEIFPPKFAEEDAEVSPAIRRERFTETPRSTCAFPELETAFPALNESETDRALPNRASLQALIADPIFAFSCTEKDDPEKQVFFTEKQQFPDTIPNTDTLLPTRAPPATDKPLPRVVASRSEVVQLPVTEERTESEEPKSTLSKTETLEPARMGPERDEDPVMCVSP
jgi:hypothetical protein